MIYIFRVTTGQEKIVSQMLEKKAKAQKLEVYSILVPENVRGYLFVEAATENDAVHLSQKTRHVKGILKQNIDVSEVEKMVKAEKPAALTIELSDIVEIKSGAFKGDKAKVIKIDENKDELTVEFMDMAVPIPTTIKRKIAKLFKKAGEED
ncbi:transcription elongation factor Spt5 [Candidatus Micrarchaeota archaeon]|nr:transcription elongation factor Spt5 [Candidatus Micrarchaeota archaeon]